MADPVITFNASTGVAEHSGCGPATAVTGTAAVHTNGADSTTLIFTDTPDLSTVSVDDVIFLQSSASIWGWVAAWNQITAVDNVAKTVTVRTPYYYPYNQLNIPVADACDYGIGGKAKNPLQGNYTLTKGNLTWKSARPGWIIEFETDQTLDDTLKTSTVPWPTGEGKPIIWRSADGTIKTFTATVDEPCVTTVAENTRFENLKFENSAATKVNAIGVLVSGGGAQYSYTQVFKNCIFGDATNTLNIGIRGNYADQPSFRLINCEIAHCISDGLYYDWNTTTAHAQGCSIHDNGGHGINLNYMSGFEILDTIIYNNSGDGVHVTKLGSHGGGGYTWAALTIDHCTIHGNTGDGIDFGGVVYLYGPPTNASTGIINCNITGNGGYGIRDTNTLTDPESGSAAFVDYNNFGTGSTSNTSGIISDGAVGPNSLTVDPGYTDTATADFSVDVSVKGLGFPNGTQTLGVGQSGTKSYVDIGAAQRQEAGGGGGGSPRLINGGLIS